MRTPAFSPTVYTPPVRGLAIYGALWAAWREPIAGFLITVGLCGAFVFPNLIHIPWWFSIGLAMAGGFIRQRQPMYTPGAFIPLWGFFIACLFFMLYAMAFNPLSEYGAYKIQTFAIFAGAAFLAGRRQAPLTQDFARGLRWGLASMLIASVVLVYQVRDFFFNQQVFGIQALKETISVTMLPLVIALSLASLVPKTMKLRSVFLYGALLLLGAMLEIFVRGRFDAILLGVIALVLVLGPPWIHTFWRVILCGVLLALAFGICVNVLPLMGDSFQYLTWLDLETGAGRGPVWQLAIQGFLTHPLGQGIGSFELSNVAYNYPHNIILEVAYEMGILGLGSMLAIYILVIRRSWQLWLSPPHRIASLLLTFIFFQMLKSGDISTLAFHWVFIYLLIVCTPVDKSWPLQRGNEVAC